MYVTYISPNSPTTSCSFSVSTSRAIMGIRLPDMYIYVNICMKKNYTCMSLYVYCTYTVYIARTQVAQHKLLLERQHWIYIYKSIHMYIYTYLYIVCMLYISPKSPTMSCSLSISLCETCIFYSYTLIYIHVNRKFAIYMARTQIAHHKLFLERQHRILIHLYLYICIHIYTYTHIHLSIWIEYIHTNRNFIYIAPKSPSISCSLSVSTEY